MPPADPRSDALLDALKPVLATLAGVDVASPSAAARVGQLLPLEGPAMQAVRALVLEGLHAGWLCPREGQGLRYGRLAKATPATHGLSIETVDMTGPGPGHTHPGGELDLCFAVEGQPTFDGQPPGWTVYPPGSWHVPTVRGGRMAILYFLPGGEIRFGPRPE